MIFEEFIRKQIGNSLTKVMLKKIDERKAFLVNIMLTAHITENRDFIDWAARQVELETALLNVAQEMIERHK